MRDVPASVLVTWLLTEANNTQTRGQGLTIINSTLVGVLVIVIALRYYARIKVTKSFGLDDWFIGAALLASIGLNVTVVLADSKYGWNKHIWNVHEAQFAPALKTAMLAKLWFTLAATFTRTSLLCFYDRLVTNSGLKWFRQVLIICQIFVAAVGVAFVFLTIFQCHPVSAYWTYPANPSFAAHCMDEGIITLISGGINSFADLLVTVVPIPLIMRLQMPKRQRIGVVILLSLGFVVTIIGILRTYYIWYVFMNTYDETWYSYPLYICATVEIDMGVICACAPAIRPLFLQLFRNSPFLKSLSSKVSATFSSQKSARSQPGDGDPATKNSSRSTDQDGEELTAQISRSNPKKEIATTSFEEVDEIETADRDGDIHGGRKGWVRSTKKVPEEEIRSVGRGPGWSGSGNSSVRALLGAGRGGDSLGAESQYPGHGETWRHSEEEV